MTSSADLPQTENKETENSDGSAQAGSPASVTGRERLDLTHLAIGLLFLLAAVLLLWPFATSDLVRTNLSYQETEAIVTESFVVKSTVRETAVQKSILKPYINVLFKVDDITYAGEPYKDYYPESESEAEQLVNRNPPGGTIMIYYDPQNPRQVISSRSWFPELWMWIPVGLGSVFLVFIGAMVFFDEFKKVGSRHKPTRDPFIERWRSVKTGTD